VIGRLEEKIMTFVSGASNSLKKNIKFFKSLITEELGSTSSPRADYDEYLNALIKKAYTEGFKKAHRTLRSDVNVKGVPKKLAIDAKTPGADAQQKFRINSKIKED
jgi:hypothetical protein